MNYIFVISAPRRTKWCIVFHDLLCGHIAKYKKLNTNVIQTFHFPNLNFIHYYQSGALLHTRSFPKHITDAEWSPSRPAVFFIANEDGTVDIWDLIDKTHAPVLTQAVSINKLAYISCSIVSRKCFYFVFKPLYRDKGKKM